MRYGASPRPAPDPHHRCGRAPGGRRSGIAGPVVGQEIAGVRARHDPDALPSRSPHSPRVLSLHGAGDDGFGEVPLDDSFKDTRAALNLSWEQPWGDRNKISVGGNISKEYDFTSLGLNAAIARDFNNKNTTLSLIQITCCLRLLHTYIKKC